MPWISLSETIRTGGVASAYACESCVVQRFRYLQQDQRLCMN